MTTPRPSARLSKSILEMKFMKRTREKVLKEEDDERSRAMYSHEITDKMKKDICQYIMEPSYVPCENLSDGRYSFRGMNPEIERLNQLENEAINAAKDKDVVKDVSDADMSASYYHTIKKTIERKFQTKNQRRKANDADCKIPFKIPKI